MANGSLALGPADQATDTAPNRFAGLALTGFLEKPFTRDRLLAHVRTVLDREGRNASVG